MLQQLVSTVEQDESYFQKRFPPDLEDRESLSSKAMSIDSPRAAAGSPKDLCLWPCTGALPSRAFPCNASWVVWLETSAIT